MTIPIYGLSGFLGLKSDWDIFKLKNLHAFDSYEFQWNSLSDWGEKFNQLAFLAKIKPLLMGYSLGGRLALHALIANPHLWHAAIIISANPGLEKKEEKLSRLKVDEEWAVRFEQEEWHSLLKSWNDQLVFKEGFQFKRNEQDYDRQQLAHILRAGSLGKQENLRDKIGQLNLPILWITGEKDEKFCQAAESVTLTHDLSKKIIFSQAGHRVPWDSSLKFQTIIENFIFSTKKMNTLNF